MKKYLLAIDQGTTSTRAILFSRDSQIIATSQKEFPQHYPADGWVEHESEDIWQTTLSTCRNVLKQANINASDIAGIGISNQRETTIVWDRKTGNPIYRAIVWQDRRTADDCHEKIAAGHEKMCQEKTGLLLDPYFSATKIHWILENVPDARARAERGELAFGTIDTFLLWRLTGGRSHHTDATNASRTLLFNIHTQQWDDELLALFDVPKSLLPTVLDSSANFGVTETSFFNGEIPILGIAGDQQAASFGQACFTPGMVKSTYGTGCFLMLNTGNKVITSHNRLLSTVAYRLKGEVSYAVEGSIFVAGAAVQWLRDTVKLVANANDTAAIAASIPDTGGVYLVPAFTGLGAPYWDPQARGAILGLTRDSGVAHIVRAALEAVCYQTRDLMVSMEKDGAAKLAALRVDGGMVKNDWLTQFLADILQVPIDRPRITETSALGAAYLAGLQAGLYSSLDELTQLWQCERHFKPSMPLSKRDALYTGWLAALKRTLSQ
jgi:glycerol kinase